MGHDCFLTPCPVDHPGVGVAVLVTGDDAGSSLTDGHEVVADGGAEGDEHGDSVEERASSRDSERVERKDDGRDGHDWEDTEGMMRRLRSGWVNGWMDGWIDRVKRKRERWRVNGQEGF